MALFYSKDGVNLIAEMPAIAQLAKAIDQPGAGLFIHTKSPFVNLPHQAGRLPDGVNIFTA